MRGVAQGQVSIEYIIVMGFSMLFLIPLLLLFYTQSGAIELELQQTQIRNAGQAIVESAERVYFTGVPARETIRVTLPDNLDRFDITNSTVYFEVRAPYRYDYEVTSVAPLRTATFNTAGGVQRMRIEATSTGVLITLV